jgi:lipoprotein NlpI
MAYYYEVVDDWLFSPREVMPKAKEAADRALAVDDTLAESHTDLGAYYCWYEWNWSAADRELKRAIELNPNYAYAHEIHGWCLIPMGRLDEGVMELRLAKQIDPLSYESSSLLGLFLYMGRRYDEAIDELHKTLDLEPNYCLANRGLDMHTRERDAHLKLWPPSKRLSPSRVHLPSRCRRWELPTRSTEDESTRNNLSSN